MNLEIFKKDEFGEIRVIEINNEPWFVAKDICDSLNLLNVTDSLKRLDDDEKLISKLSISGQNRDVWVINESGLYSLVLTSNKAEAKKFKKWITNEVLPTIRKHGAYLIDNKIEEILSNPDTIIKLATDLKAEREKRKILEAEAEGNQPYVNFAKAVETSETTMLIRNFAKSIYDEKGIKIGEKTLFAWLRENKILMADNMPYQSYLNSGYFELATTLITRTSGIQEKHTPKLTSKGRIWLTNKLVREF